MELPTKSQQLIYSYISNPWLVTFRMQVICSSDMCVCLYIYIYIKLKYKKDFKYEISLKYLNWIQFKGFKHVRVFVNVNGWRKKHKK